MTTYKSGNRQTYRDCHSRRQWKEHGTPKSLASRRMFAAIGRLFFAGCMLGALTQAQVPGSHQGGGHGARAAGRSRDAQAQMEAITCPKGEDLLTVPEIKSVNGTLKALITVTDGERNLWGYGSDVGCPSQDIRYFTGQDLQSGGAEDPVFSKKDPIPGPTLRARVGDLIEITFRNQVNPLHFAQTLDQAENQPNNTTGCDEVYGTVDWTAQNPYSSGFQINPAKNNPGGFVFTAQTPASGGTSGSTEPVFPQVKGQTVTDREVVWVNAGSGQIQIYPDSLGDAMPDCLHGSSTSNLHFHGTHTTPSTTGDNVLLFILPALRTKGQIQPNDAQVTRDFSTFFKQCERSGSPTTWDQMPEDWRSEQEALLKEYDETAPFHGKPGNLPEGMKLWPVNQKLLSQGLWPQYQIGAYPYCFRLAKYNEPTVPGSPPALMGQSPGTHWYHAHKHGSTALNVANGMTGAFIIEGQYDDDLHKFYGNSLREQVLMIQQLAVAPFPLLSPLQAGKPPGAPTPGLSVNGRLQPVVKMRPGEVQLWRIINGAFRDAVRIESFNPASSNQPCTQPGVTPIVVPCVVSWRQIAQDGVQFSFASYQRVGTPNRPLNMAPANRADLLVKAPAQPGKFSFLVQQNVSDADPGNTPIALLTVSVEGDAVTPAMDFIQEKKDFPTFPGFLADIPESEIKLKRQIVFGPGFNTIDGKPFDPYQVNQAMLLNSAEEWTVMNQANDKSHPFHIHINPFQVTAVFEPNSKAATTKGDPCYVDPNNPETFKPCPSHQTQGPFVWSDTFAIPTGQQITLQKTDKSPNTPTCAKEQDCPAPLRPYVQCPPYPPGTPYASPYCTEFIPGYFTMRSRFADFTGQYVLHCHILIHEDRGMMQLIEVVTDRTLYTHH